MPERFGASLPRWQLPPADPASYRRTARETAAAIRRQHRWLLLAFAGAIVLIASEVSTFVVIHNSLVKGVLVALAAGVGSLIIAAPFIWVVSWVVAGAIAHPRQLSESIHQHDEAQKTIRELMKGVNDLQKIRSELSNKVGVLTSQLDAALEDRNDARAQLRVLHDPSRIEGLRVKIDAMAKRGFALYKELNTGPEAIETDEEGRGIAFPMFPPESKWESVYEFVDEANALIQEYDPGLSFAFADGINAARRKRRRRERQRDERQKKLPNAEQVRYGFERLHRAPADDLECYVNALVDVRKEL